MNMRAVELGGRVGKMVWETRRDWQPASLLDCVFFVENSVLFGWA
jgi:hypothetical protein